MAPFEMALAEPASSSALPSPFFYQSCIIDTYITTHLEQQPPDDPSGLGGRGRPSGGEGSDGYDDISLLYLRISRTISKNALSTLMRDLADVSMNAQPNCRARSSPSIKGNKSQRILTENGVMVVDCDSVDEIDRPLVDDLDV